MSWNLLIGRFTAIHFALGCHQIFNCLSVVANIVLLNVNQQRFGTSYQVNRGDVCCVAVNIATG
ncbi:hypothetical protein [Nitrosomonas sp. Is79A3]|uniref:hypothetical protein n=1 Tax=Nitrosomonas sp. (strain Is79A3) TaxID=261292 RepID=UPI00059B7E64